MESQRGVQVAEVKVQAVEYGRTLEYGPYIALRTSAEDNREDWSLNIKYVLERIGCTLKYGPYFLHVLVDVTHV